MGQSEHDIRRPGLFPLLNILSLDVAAGAFAWAWMLNGFRFKGMPPFYFVILPLAVWVIYTADHLLDAHRLKGAAHTSRHRFHYLQFRPLSAVWLAGLGACLILAFLNLPGEGIYLGLVLGGLTFLHLALVRWVGPKVSPFVLKEFAIAGIYTAGIWGLPWLLSGEVSLDWYLSALQFFLLALINLLLFSVYEYEVDEQDGHGSFVRGIGKRRALWLINALLFVVFWIGQLIWVKWSHAGAPISWPFICMTVMMVLYWVMLFSRKWFSRNERYRLIGDGVYLLPLLIGIVENIRG